MYKSNIFYTPMEYFHKLPAQTIKLYIMKKIFILLAGIIMFSACGPSQEEIDRQNVYKLQDDELLKEALLAAEEDEQKRAQEVYERTRLTVEKIDDKIAEIKRLDFTNLYSIDRIREALEYIRNDCHFALRANLEDDEALKKKGKEYELFFKNFQKKEFPKLRAAYIELSRSKLWEHDIEVHGKGTSITYTAGIFASNASIKAFHEELRSMLYDLRFQRVNYKWYKHDDDYQYYTLHAPKDDELI